jgi:hypothetical protein
LWALKFAAKSVLDLETGHCNKRQTLGLNSFHHKGHEVTRMKIKETNPIVILRGSGLCISRGAACQDDRKRNVTGVYITIKEAGILYAIWDRE